MATGGPATSKLPVILVGDLNSDVKTEVKPGAYAVFIGGGQPAEDTRGVQANFKITGSVRLRR